jgi:glycosyltransferase involved in cell wall biosynthesis/thymidylate kinase
MLEDAAADRAGDDLLPARPSVLVVGRAVHPPWNEGTRVIAHLTASAAATRVAVATVSVTHEDFREVAESMRDVRHVFTGRTYGTVGDYLTLPRVMRHIAHIFRERPVAVTHLVGAPMSLAPWLRRRGSRVVAHVTLTRQAYLPFLDRLRAVLAWRLFGRWVDAFACSSEVVRDDLLARGQRPESLHVIPSPVDIDTYSPGDRTAARRRLGWADDAFVVAYVGTVSPLRFPAAVVFEALRGAHPEIAGLRMEIHAPLATHGYNVDWARDAVHASTAVPGVPVTVAVGDLDPADKVNVYRAADAVLLPFAAAVAVEPPLTLLEAMACGAIALVAPAANRSRVVVHEVNGLTWDGPAGLAAALVGLANLDPARRHALAVSARRTIERDHSIEAVAACLEQMWSTIGVPGATGRPVEAGARDATRARRGLTVAVVGADGAGKSSLIAALDALEELPTVPIYMGVDRLKATHMLPTTRWLLARRARGTAPQARGVTRVSAGAARGQPQARHRVVGAIHDLVALPHEMLEFRYRYRVGRKVQRTGRIALFDRYVYDAIVDARVDHRRGWPRLRAELLRRAAPAPDVAFLLEAPGDVLFARKGEYDPARLDAVTAAHRVAAARARRVVRLDASRPLATLVREAADVLMEEAGIAVRPARRHVAAVAEHHDGPATPSAA